MMGRRRSAKRAGWPDNLYPCKEGFKYRHPVTRKEHWMGMDKQRAFTAAKSLNGMLGRSGDLVAKVIGGGETIASAIKEFRAEDMPGRKWAPATASNYESVLSRLEAAAGNQELATFGVRECANCIREITESPRSRQQFRLVLSWVLACAVERGWIDSNPALATRKASYERARARLTKAQYDAIWDRADPWLRNAMDISLATLLRREDVVGLRFADVRGGKLFVVPGKTEGTTGVRLRITVTPALDQVLTRCRDDVVSPFLVHRLPDRLRPSDKRAKAREHHTQVLPEQLTRAFADARDAVGLGGDGAATFHEIRSLGGALLREAGWTQAQVQTLMTHASPAMTEHYLAGHDTPWTDVEPGISLTR
jgi:enterobacteria phage integrase